MTTKAEQALLIDEHDQLPEPKNALAKQELNPLVMLNEALQRNLNPETLERLMALYERWQAEQNRLKFDEALRAFKADKPAILKTKRVIYDTKNGKADYKHPTLDGTLDVIDPELDRHGLSVRWRPETLPDGKVQVTCILSGFGHREEYPLAGPSDTTGSKNALQAIGSSITYLQRYTVLPALGLAATDDDDGRGGPDSKEPRMENLAEHLEYIDNCRERGELRKIFDVAWKAASDVGDKSAKAALVLANGKKLISWARTYQEGNNDFQGNYKVLREANEQPAMKELSAAWEKAKRDLP